jgi:hypothetical protein
LSIALRVNGATVYELAGFALTVPLKVRKSLERNSPPALVFGHPDRPKAHDAPHSRVI